MGMDIYGLNPTGASIEREDRMEQLIHEMNNGIYFRAAAGSWTPILNCCKLASNLKNLNIDFEYWDSNDGEGLRTQEECTKLADALDEMLETSTEHKTKHIQYFITFLRNCGGFKIW